MTEMDDKTYQPQEENMPGHPGGNTTQVMWNEKDILDDFVERKAVITTPQSLPASNRQFRQGIYTSNSAESND